MDLVTSETIVAGLTVLSLRGELDMATVPQLHGALTRLVAEQDGRVVAVDVDGVYACDDTALGVVLGAAGRARESGGDMVVVCSDGALRRRLARTGFDRAVVVAASIADVSSSVER